MGAPACVLLYCSRSSHHSLCLRCKFHFHLDKLLLKTKSANLLVLLILAAGRFNLKCSIQWLKAGTIAHKFSRNLTSNLVSGGHELGFCAPSPALTSILSGEGKFINYHKQTWYLGVFSNIPHILETLLFHVSGTCRNIK